MENAKKFFEEVAKAEEAKALFAAAEAPKDEKERILAYIEIANKLGIALTAEGIAAYLLAAANQEPAESELDDEELQQLVGGGDHRMCETTYQHGENCWVSDGCDMLFNDFGGYDCSHHYKGQTFADTIGDVVNEIKKAYDFIDSMKP